MDTATRGKLLMLSAMEGEICVGVGTEISLSHKTRNQCTQKQPEAAFADFVLQSADTEYILSS